MRRQLTPTLARVIGVISLAAVLFVPSPPVSAQPIWPYRTVVVEPIRYYTDPQVARELTWTPNLSYVALSREIVQSLRLDPRFEPVETETPGSNEASPEAETNLELADSRRQLGIDAFGRYEIGTAIDHLEAAISAYRDADAELSHPRDVATAHEYLARAYLERAYLEPEMEPRWTSLARDHFKAMIRLQPDADVREGLYPPVVVNQFRQAYAELLRNEGADLRLPESAIAALARRFDADRLVHAFAIRDADGARLIVEVYDVAGSRGTLSFRQVVPLTADTESSRERVNRVFSRYLACVPSRHAPEPPGGPGDSGRYFLSAGWSAGVYGENPTALQYIIQGVTLMVDYHLTDYLGFFGRANVMFSGRDPRGDLLHSYTSTRMDLGVALSARFGPVRPFFGTGLELNFVGALSASTTFWCKVTGGQPGPDGADEACVPERDVTRQPSTTLLGPYLMPGISIDIYSPFAAYLLGSFAFYLNTENNIDFPLVGEAGIEYRF